MKNAAAAKAASAPARGLRLLGVIFLLTSPGAGIG
jgi:hypothetical protein